MMAKIYDVHGKEAGTVELPAVFKTEYKPSLIKKAVLAMQANKRQAYGRDPLAGKKTSAHYHGSRHYRYTMMNKEMARIARIHGRIGYLAFTARFVPQAVKGRKAHPPVAEKVWTQKINKKEARAAVRSLIAATANAEIVKARGHLYENQLPVIVTNDFEKIAKAKEMAVALEKVLGSKEMARSGQKKIRAGKGKTRGRKYRQKIGPLLVVSAKCDAMKACSAIPGVNVVTASNVNAEFLAPGTHAGRLAVYTVSALKELEKRFA
ncbi:MAG: 50S ribosomal protein L4 [Candidatus Aenigmarchaeota archaeon]|nr:50S ribosomal protein L4 [Candidatus Aenigmarchaeota archaeon]